ncbi:ABC transporter permease [Anaerocolumna xylanovorans]|uniref:Putative ABC transport system permease protein n=1 Tax=Anaerocolumna xylanovorans DSM 12503 TaxID=1121345 RepID=A0A1M7XZG2_9FIRM|nr:ABC transporter permease [Anaerocolumna xylanovorans]SHO44455.1 putative ABC transport system permease protein [Anaerocolumna xylanovorans DSM 12503]
MKKILLLSFSNIRKNKGQMVNLLLVVFIAGFLLNLGLLLFFNFGKFYDELCRKTNSPHAAFLMAQTSAGNAQNDYLKYYPGVTELEQQEVLADNADIQYNGDKMPGLFMMVKASRKQAMNPLKLIGPSNPLSDNSIYLPYIMKTGGKLKLGDDFYVSVQGKEYHYTIAGFTEEVYFGSNTIQWYRFYLSDKEYDKLKESLPASVCVLQTVRMERPELSDRLVKDFAGEFYYGTTAKNTSIYHDSVYSNVKTSHTFLSGITSMIFVALAAVILLVSLVVIRFRIHNTLEESMVGIGVLKAMGYLSRQIIASLVIQFTGIAAAGILLGTVLSYVVLPLISSLLESQTALIWHQGFDPVISGITLLAILSVILLDTVLTSLRIRKMHPLTALRGGITTHNFRRNSFALDSSHGGLTVLLAMKNIYQNRKQTLMIFAVITTITFASASVLSIYYNVGLHPDTFAGLVAGEVPDSVFILKNPVDAAGVMAEIRQSEKVDKAIYYTFRSVLVNGTEAQGYVTDDFSLIRGKMLYKGRYPKHDNEIALSGVTAKQAAKTIGDTVSVNYNGKNEEYLITGLIQTMNDNGNGLTLTTKGMKRLYPDFVSEQIYVYMKDVNDTEEFIDTIKLKSGSLFSNTLNMNKLIDVQLGVYGSVFAIITTAITLITFFVVILVLYLVLKTSILRRRRELGIQKAVGFTSFQLMNQIALSFSPAIITGVTAGCILGIYCFNPLFVALVQSMGIMTASLPASYAFTIILAIGIIVFSYLISLLISMRIRKITPYMLVSE